MWGCGVGFGEAEVFGEGAVEELGVRAAPGELAADGVAGVEAGVGVVEQDLAG